MLVEVTVWIPVTTQIEAESIEEVQTALARCAGVRDTGRIQPEEGELVDDIAIGLGDSVHEYSTRDLIRTGYTDGFRVEMVEIEEEEEVAE